MGHRNWFALTRLVLAFSSSAFLNAQEEHQLSGVQLLTCQQEMEYCKKSSILHRCVCDVVCVREAVFRTLGASYSPFTNS